MSDEYKKYTAELVGTMVLVLFGCGAAVFGAGLLGTAFAFGLAIVAMAYTIGPISGCHVNPAVSLAMFMNKRLNKKYFIGYVIAQMIGAIVGAVIIYIFLKFSDYNTITMMGQNGFGSFDAIGALFVEVVLTFVFVVVVMTTTGKNGNPTLAGIVIGLTLVLVHILGINLTGTSVNPARSLAPALFVGKEALEQLWVFLVAPFIGAALAALFTKNILNTEKNNK